MTRPANMTNNPDRDDPWLWWYRLFAVWIAVVHGLVGAALILGPHTWTLSNSLASLHDLSHIPWPLWGAVFWVLGLAIAFGGRTWCLLGNRINPRKIAYLTSASISAVFEVASIIWTVLPGKTTNPIVIGFSTLSVLTMVSGARYCEMQEATRRVADIVNYRYDKGAS